MAATSSSPRRVAHRIIRQWYLNLQAHLQVEVQVGTMKLTAKARTVEGAERAKLWQEALKFWPPYADYATKTDREIPVVVLEPVS